jgi:hypothetical protein
VAINDYSEKKIRQSILNKINPSIQNGKHDKGYIYIDGVLITKVKIPNNHKRTMHNSKSKYIARNLRLTDDEFNALNDCTLTGAEYYRTLKDKEVQSDI